MSACTITAYFPFRRVRLLSQSVSREADLAVIKAEPDKNFSPICCVCGQRARSVHSWHSRAIRDLNLANARVSIFCRYRRIHCERCQTTRLEDLELFDPSKRVTRRMERYIHELCKFLPVKQVAEHLGLDWKTVKVVDKSFLEEEYRTTDYSALSILAVDEIAIRKGHHYMTVVLDYLSGRVVWMGEHRTKETLQNFFRGMSAEQKASLKAIAMDMWEPFIAAVKEETPHMKIVFDLFHVVAAFNKVIDAVRNEEYRKASTEDKEVIKGSKYLLLKNRENLRKKEHRLHLKRLLSLNKTLSTVMILKDELKMLWRYRYRASARKALHRWRETARSIGHPQLDRFARRLETFAYGIVNHCDYPIHTSKLEGVNNKIKVIKRKAYGFHDLDYFRLKVIQAFDPRNDQQNGR